MITHKELLERLHYDRATGIFTWKKPAFNKRQYIGKVAGSEGKDGYLFIKVNSRPYAASRLAWFYEYGVWPDGVIDHKDHAVTNNAIDNLRDVPFSGNSQNQINAHKDSTHGFLGVRKDYQRGTYLARIQTNGKRIALGHFKTPEQAHQAYLAAKRELHITCVI